MSTFTTHITASAWRRGYRLTMQVGLVLSLLAVVGLIHLPLRAKGELVLSTLEQELVQLEDIQQTFQPVKPPPPPRALIPIVVPDESLPDEVPLDLDASLDLDAVLAVPVTAPAPPVLEDAEEDLEPEVFIVVEHMPEILGGLEKLYSLLEYPRVAANAGLEGMVIVQYTVDETGRPLDPVVQRSAGQVLDDAAIDAIMQLTFTPGRQRNRPVKVRMTVPVRFRLESASTPWR